MADSAIDLRSDTFTTPTAEMRAAMAAAHVGDDVFGEDPTICRLEEQVAARLGKEAAVFVPSGTMSNQIALRLHCDPGDEFLCEADCHILNYEQAAYAQLFGIAARPIQGDYGVLQPEQVVDCVRPDDDHSPRTRLLCLENTHNRGAGRIQPYDLVESLCDWAASAGLARHLDGARLFNAVVATGISADQWARHFDTVSVCFSKGLGAPVGSALSGPRNLIRRARRLRKALGGGMRQAGIIAAGALYALQNHVERLQEDHQKAQVLADGVRRASGLVLDPDIVDTNMVIFKVPPETGDAEQFCQKLAAAGVKMLAVGKHRVRAVTHLDVSLDEVASAAEILAACSSDMTEAGRSASHVGTAP